VKTTSIDFCIPYVGKGLVCLEFLIQNALQTSTHPDRIKFNVSYHTEDDLALLKSSTYFKYISKVIYAEPFSESIPFFASANHSLAINNLINNSESEIIIICDYDMSFVKIGWDSLIVNQILTSESDCLGVAYQPFIMKLQFAKIPWLSNVQLIKYQKLPNLSFFCLKRSVFVEIFNRKLTSFDKFLSEGGLPFRLINTEYLSLVNNLPLGTMQWLDTGYEIPEIIHENKLKYKTLFPVDYNQQNILDYLTKPKETPMILLPEIFFLETTTPFLCHFKKGTAKLTNGNGDYEFQKFKYCVERFLDLQK
jgi:hypothetical protein